MLFSLVTTTIYRTTQVLEFIDSLKKQTVSDFELLLVDQNTDNRLKDMLQTIELTFPLKHLSSDLGISKGRNAGLREATGEIIAFPDDDCRYFPDTLEKVKALLTGNTIDGLSGKTIDEEGHDSVNIFLSEKALITSNNIWRSHNSTCLFVSKSVTESVGMFDENLGVNAPFGSSEETDYVVRALEKGHTLQFVPEITIFHPNVEHVASSRKLAKRGLNYGRGVSYLLARHARFFGIKAFIKAFIGPIVKAITSLPHMQKVIFNSAIFIGRIQGLIMYVISYRQ